MHRNTLRRRDILRCSLLERSEAEIHVVKGMRSWFDKLTTNGSFSSFLSPTVLSWSPVADDQGPSKDGRMSRLSYGIPMMCICPIRDPDHMTYAPVSL